MKTVQVDCIFSKQLYCSKDYPLNKLGSGKQLTSPWNQENWGNSVSQLTLHMAIETRTRKTHKTISHLNSFRQKKKKVIYNIIETLKDNSDQCYNYNKLVRNNFVTQKASLILVFVDSSLRFSSFCQLDT